MTGELGPLRAPRRNGSEAFHRGTAPLGFDLADFWAWSVSDLVSNATRGRLAEYLVARALGLSTAGVRNEWAGRALPSSEGPDRPRPEMRSRLPARKPRESAEKVAEPYGFLKRNPAETD
jgi:hypothetical protein